MLFINIFAMPKKSASRPKLSLPKGRSAFAKKTIEGVNRVVLKSRRNSSIGRVERGSSQPAIPEMGHKKNTKSLKIGQDDLKRMLMERMQKRHISKKEIVSGTDGGIGPD